MPVDLMCLAQCLPDGLYDHPVYGVRFAVEGGVIAAWIDRDRMERDIRHLNTPWNRPWGTFNDPDLCLRAS